MANVESGRPGDAFAAGAAGTAKARLGMVRVALWLVAAVLAVRQVAVVLSTPKGERLTDLETWVGPGGVLHVNGSLVRLDALHRHAVRRTRPQTAHPRCRAGPRLGLDLRHPAAGRRARPGRRPRPAAAGEPPHGPARRARRDQPADAVAAGAQHAVTSARPASSPCCWCCSAASRSAGNGPAGVLIGLAAALQPTVLLFAPLLWFTGRRRAAALHRRHLRRVHRAGLGGDAARLVDVLGAPPRRRRSRRARRTSLANQSLHGALLRLGLTGPLEIALFLLLAAAVAFLGLRRAVRYARDGQLLLAVALTGCVAVAVSPTAWQHQLLWVLLARGRPGRQAGLGPVRVAGRRRPGDDAARRRCCCRTWRCCYPLRDNVAAARRARRRLRRAVPVPHLAVLPAPIPTQYAPPAEARWKHVPLLPFLRRVLTRPNLLLELLLIRVGYSAYSAGQAGGARRPNEAAGPPPRSTASRSSPSRRPCASTSSTGSTTRW